MGSWKSKKDGTHFNNDKKKRDVGGHYEITETEVKANFEPMYEDEDKFAEKVRKDFEDADWIDGHLVTKADQKSYDDMMRKKGAIDTRELEMIGNVLGKRRLSIVADNPVDHLKDVNGRFLGKRSRLFHSKSVNEEMLPLDEYEKVVGVWDE